MPSQATPSVSSTAEDCPPHVHDPPQLASSSSSSRWDPTRNTTNHTLKHFNDTMLASSTSSAPSSTSSSSTNIVLMAPFFPHGEKSLAGIALRAFCLGASLTFSLLAVLYIVVLEPTGSGPHPIWRAPFFLGALSVFHFLEFWVTAQRNTLVANVDSFLLTQNWPSYAIAHSLAFVETILVSVFFPHRNWSFHILGYSLQPIWLLLGLLLTLIGQTVRTVAMYQAGASFNHQVQQRRAATHTLVTRGIYGWIRHPSYFGFFWWGLGTQLVLGNVVCFCAYAVVLWVFFRDRIEHEEDRLVDFFKEDYQRYRKRVPTLLPFIG